MNFPISAGVQFAEARDPVLEDVGDLGRARLRLDARDVGEYARFVLDTQAHVVAGDDFRQRQDRQIDHRLGLERQVRQMRRQGLVVTSQTLWDQI